MSGHYLESILDMLRGPRDEFRQILMNKNRLLYHVCKYAARQAKRRRIEPWSIISHMTTHGSGVSSAIYELYKDDRDIPLDAEFFYSVTRGSKVIERWNDETFVLVLRGGILIPDVKTRGRLIDIIESLYGATFAG